MSSLIVSAKGGKEFVIHPAGVTAARCTRIIDLGTVDGEWKGKAKKSHKVSIQFESADLMDEDQGDYAGKPFLISQQDTFSLSPKANMLGDLESWRGRKFTKVELEGFDLKNVLNKSCMVNIVHSDPTAAGKVYANIRSIMPLPAGMTMPPSTPNPTFFSLSKFDQTIYDSLSDYYKTRIALSDEFKAIVGGRGKASSKAPPVEDDDIPF
jgi:hypothetical protein